MIYQPIHFRPEELVDRATWAKWGTDSLRYFRPELLRALDWIRECYPSKGKRSINLNNWVWGGLSEWRGLRLPGSVDWKPYSAHSWGAALDIVPQGITMDDMRAWILAQHADILREGHMDHPLMAIRRMEIGTPTWVHIDCLSGNSEEIKMINP